MTKGRKGVRRNGRQSRAPAVQFDELITRTVLRPNLNSVTGTATNFAYEVPLTLMNFSTTADIGDWNTAKQFLFRNMRINVNVFDLLATGQRCQFFIGWNKTPSGGIPTSVETLAGVYQFLDKCDRKVVSKNLETVGLSLSVKSTGWKQYYSAAVYMKYKDILDREVNGFCHGSLVFGFTGAQVDKKAFLTACRIECIQVLRLAKPTSSGMSVHMPGGPIASVPVREGSRPSPNPYD